MPIISIILLLLTFAVNFIMDFIFWFIVLQLAQMFTSKSFFPVGHELNLVIELTLLVILVPATLSMFGFMQKYFVWSNGGRTAEGYYYDRLFSLLSDICKRGKLGDPHLYHLHICHDPSINAFAMGSSHITVNIGSLEHLNDYELEGIMAHEMGHLQHGHTMVSLCICGMDAFSGIVCLGYRFILFMCRIFAWIPILNWFIVIFSYFIAWQYKLCLWFLRIPANLISLFGSRRHEYQADQYAFELGLGQNLIDSFYAMERFYGNQKSGFFDSFWQDHPDLDKRIARIQKMMEEQSKASQNTNWQSKFK